MALKWGIVSAGKVANDFLNALGTLNAADHQVVAIAARDINRAKELAKRYDIPKAYGNYLELAQDPNVEVAYIAVLNRQHFEIALLMLQHGKHVLLEKPMCINEKQVRQVVSLAKEKNLFLMEAIWSRFFPSYQYIRDQIKSGKLGEILTVEAEYGTGNDDRITKKELGGGTILDVGIYTIQLCQWVFQEEPKSIKATGILNDDGVDLEMTAELKYTGNKVAKMKTSAIQSLSNAAKIIGTKGTITVEILNCPTTIIDIDGTEKNWPLPEAKHKFNYTNMCGLRYEIDCVRKCIRAGKVECETVTHNESLIIARIEDEIRKQIGVTFPEDN